ncbi:MAG: class I SAM-dependent methyltransferase [Thermomicrobiales bacterium]
MARAYVHRPPYPEELYAFLASLPSRRRVALDLGCGPGKIARRLAVDFARVDAVDPSLAMLRVADDGRQSNINWIHGSAESVGLTGMYDLITAGASVHWMDHEIVFPRMARVLAPGGFLAVIDGDEARDAPWQSEWAGFLRHWLGRLGRAYDPGGHREWMSEFQPWMDVAGRRTFDCRFSQTVDGFIECQHSRSTWSRANLGPDLTLAFDADLRDLLSPHAVDDVVTYWIRTELVWGRPRSEPAD